jgi:F-type H+-transporting ATPase subunit c
MDAVSLVAMVSIVTSGLTISIGSIAPAVAGGLALASALKALAQQPDQSNTITRNLFVGMAFIESTAIYCLVISVILLFINPIWNQVLEQSGGGG